MSRKSPLLDKVVYVLVHVVFFALVALWFYRAVKTSMGL